MFLGSSNLEYLAIAIAAAGGLPAVRLQAWRPGGRKALPARPGIANRGAALAGCLA